MTRGESLWTRLALLTCACAAGLIAQTTTAELRGTALDPSSAVIPGVQVTATNVETGFKRSVSTNDSGGYVIADLPYGNFEITATKTGFQRLVRTGGILNIGDRRTLDLKLAMGDVSQTINVSGEAPLLRQVDASLGQVIDNARIEQIPVIGRSFDQMLYMIPGSQVSPTGQYSANSLMTG